MLFGQPRSRAKSEAMLFECTYICLFHWLILQSKAREGFWHAKYYQNRLDPVVLWKFVKSMWRPLGGVISNIVQAQCTLPPNRTERKRQCRVGACSRGNDNDIQINQDWVIVFLSLVCEAEEEQQRIRQEFPRMLEPSRIYEGISEHARELSGVMFFGLQVVCTLHN